MVHVLQIIVTRTCTYSCIIIIGTRSSTSSQVPCWYFKVQPYSPIKKLRSCIQIQYRRYDTQVPRYQYNYGCTCTSSCLKVPVLSIVPGYSGTNNLQLYIHLQLYTYVYLLQLYPCTCQIQYVLSSTVVEEVTNLANYKVILFKCFFFLKYFINKFVYTGTRLSQVPRYAQYHVSLVTDTNLQI